MDATTETKSAPAGKSGITFHGSAARLAFRREWQRRTGYSFDERDLLTTDGAERAADIANEIAGVKVSR